MIHLRPAAELGACDHERWEGRADGPKAAGENFSYGSKGLDPSIMDVRYKETGDSKYRAHSLLRKYVRAGWLGRKSGRGVYQY